MPSGREEGHRPSTRTSGGGEGEGGRGGGDEATGDCSTGAPRQKMNTSSMVR